MQKKIISAGMLCLDVSPVFGPKSDGNILAPGRLIEIGEADIHTGGSVANTGLALHFFGADVLLMSKVGRDSFGELTLQLLKRHGAQQSMSISDEAGTSYSIVLSPAGADRILLHYPGASDTFDYDDIDFEKVSGASHFHFGYPTVMKRMYENAGEELLRIFRTVKELGLTTSLDMAAIDADSPAARVDWPALLKKLLPFVDFFLPSAEELCFLIDRKRHARWRQRAGSGNITHFLDTERDIRPLVETLMEWGPGAVLVKCGALGMYLRVGRGLEGRFPGWTAMEQAEAGYEPECLVSTTGAGDTSIAAFLKAMTDGYDPLQCMRMAIGAGTCCLTRQDALSGLLPFDVIRDKIRAGWKKSTV